MRSVLTATSGFAVPIVLTDPEGTEHEISGIAADIGLTIDPDTGVMVHGRKATVAISLALLAELGLSIPEAQPDEDTRPWLVTWTPSTGPAQTMAVVGAIPDKLGCVVLELSAYRGQ